MVQVNDTRSDSSTGRNDVSVTGNETGRGQSVQGLQQTGKDVSVLQSRGDGNTGVGLSVDESRGEGKNTPDTRTESPQRKVGKTIGESTSGGLSGISQSDVSRGGESPPYNSTEDQ